MGQMLATSNEDYDDDSSFSEEEEEDETSEEPQFERPFHNEQNYPEEQICLDSATDTVDAAPSTTTMPISVTVDQVLQIENGLDVYEKVSLVYLLYDDPKTALDQLTQLVKGNEEKLVYNWAIYQILHNVPWQEKLIEAVCIIQNYEVLRDLGFKKEDLRVRFLPHHSFTFVNVNKIRKSLYFLCEEFIQSDFENLIKLVYEDFRKKGFEFKVNQPYLELYLLHWENMGYIKQDDLSNFCRILKQMDQLDLCEKLKELVPVTVTEPKPSTSGSAKLDKSKKASSVFDQILDPKSSLASLESHISADNAIFVSSENKYVINPENPGKCLIINQENFYRDVTDPTIQHLLPPLDNKLEPRTGTQHDKDKLEEIWKRFGYNVITEENLIHTGITKKIEEVINTVKDESSLVVCIMSHGNEGVVYGVNSCQVPVKTIKNLMCNRNRKHLAGKPKILILQSCQGTRCQRIPSDLQDEDIVMDGPSSPPTEVVPPCADLFTFWATVPGFGAIRNKKKGSWFIQSLCEKMAELGNKLHFEDICTQVVGDVSSKKWSQTNEEVAMVPLKDSTFRKLFYLPPIRN